MIIVNKVENVSDWLFYTGEALKEMADWPGLTVHVKYAIILYPQFFFSAICM